MPLTIAAETIERARAGGEGLDRLIGAVWPEAYRLAAAILRDRWLAEDAAQEACAAIARFLPSLKNSSAFVAWSYTIVARHALETLRRQPRMQSLDSIADRGISFDRSGALDLETALAKLTPLQRTLVLLHYYAGLPSRQIAGATSLAPSTVRFHLMLARRVLRNALAVTTQSTYDEVLSDVR
ncbi:MAG: sigma-70 family RNA polymerase sigma factor [Candidatus Eremiobacteraeota bacterium]|nr:sigma-70 family RNA polymerase sigma factor [Candidatus Eremiobacteraeota bacterium]